MDSWDLLSIVAIMFAVFGCFIMIGTAKMVEYRMRRIVSIQNQYIYKALKQVNPQTPPPVAIENRVEGVKGRVWSPKKDLDYVMRGKVVDPFD